MPKWRPAKPSRRGSQLPRQGHRQLKQAAPLGRVDAQPLPTQNAAPPSYPGPSSTYYPPRDTSYPPRDTTGSFGSRASLASGTEITVQPGETVDRLARRYGVSRAAIMRANRLTAAGSIQAGQRLVIPGRHAVVSITPAASSTRNVARLAPRTAPGGVHVVAAGETLSAVAHRYRVSRHKLAKANNLTADARLQIGQQLTIPGASAPRVAGVNPTQPSQPTPGQLGSVAADAHSQARQRVATADATAPLPSAEPAVAKIEGPIESASSGIGFRWPVRGRVISGFGPEPNGERNYGINLAVPEGTSIKAAEDGVVSYAGNELKGYGNLLLIRHSNGFVTAYAHASELLVKRGDQVKRGQIIARAGQTGNVTSPQVHFEIRKGATPVDPMQYLSGT